MFYTKQKQQLNTYAIKKYLSVTIERESKVDGINSGYLFLFCNINRTFRGQTPRGNNNFFHFLLYKTPGHVYNNVIKNCKL